MQFKVTALVPLLLAVGVAAQDDNRNQFQIWDSTDCSGSAKGSFGGDNDLQTNYVTGYGGYIGSIMFTEISQWASQLNDNTDCIYTGTDCCAGAPTCRLNPAVNWYVCNKLDMDVGDLVVSNTICDTLCWDNIYKEANGTEVVESE